MKKILRYVLAIFCFTLITNVFANISVPVYLTTDQGTDKALGTITISETQYGLLFTPDLHGLPPGPHGFHIHQNASCEANGSAAGGHLDPANTTKHRGPYSEKGHLGDLPVLYVTAAGTANTPLLAPRLHQIIEVKNHALMIHLGGDNYSDSPEKLGGGGARFACGVIK